LLDTEIKIFFREEEEEGRMGGKEGERRGDYRGVNRGCLGGVEG